MPTIRIASVPTVLFLLSLFCFQSTASHRATAAEPAAKEPMLAHMVFFTLKDSTAENRKKLLDAGREYLGGHPGEVYFSMGTMADMKQPVSVTDFDIALHIVFENKAAQDKYLVSEQHLKFVTVAKELDKSVRVFDSYLESMTASDANSK